MISAYSAIIERTPATIRYCIRLHLLGNFSHQFLVAFLRLAIALQPALHRLALSLQKLLVRERPEIFASQNRTSTQQGMVSILAPASVDWLGGDEDVAHK